MLRVSRLRVPHLSTRRRHIFSLPDFSSVLPGGTELQTYHEQKSLPCVSGLVCAGTQKDIRKVTRASNCTKSSPMSPPTTTLFPSAPHRGFSALPMKHYSSKARPCVCVRQLNPHGGFIVLLRTSVCRGSGRAAPPSSLPRLRPPVVARTSSAHLHPCACTRVPARSRSPTPLTSTRSPGPVHLDPCACTRSPPPARLHRTACTEPPAPAYLHAHAPTHSPPAARLDLRT
jgi:hypothetical protein